MADRNSCPQRGFGLRDTFFALIDSLAITALNKTEDRPECGFPGGDIVRSRLLSVI